MITQTQSDAAHVHLEGRNCLEVIRAMRIGASAGLR